jgi:hypothetical protein
MTSFRFNDPLAKAFGVQFAAGRMEPKGFERHRWVKPRGREERERISQSAVADEFNDSPGESLIIRWHDFFGYKKR